MYAQLVADPRLRGVRPRARRQGADPRARALEHRPGRRRRRVGARARRLPTPSTAPTGVTTSSSPRPCGYLHPKGIDATADFSGGRPRLLRPADAGRDLRARPRFLARPRRLDAPAVEGGRRDRHQRDRRRRRPARRRFRHGPPVGRDRRGRRSPTSATAPATSVPRWRRSTWLLPGPCRSASSSRTTCTRSSTNVAEVTGEPRLSARGPGFGIPSWKVDGMDPLAVYLAMQEASRAHARRQRSRRWSRLTSTATSTRTGLSPAARSVTAARRRSSSGGTATRSLLTATWLTRRDILTAGAGRRRRPRGQGTHGRDSAPSSSRTIPHAKAGVRRIKPAEWPDPKFVDVGVRGDLSEFDDVRVADRDRHPRRVP